MVKGKRGGKEVDSRFALDSRFREVEAEAEAGPSRSRSNSLDEEQLGNDINEGASGTDTEENDSETGNIENAESGEEEEDEEVGEEDEEDGMDPEGFAGPKEKVVKPLTPEALAAFKAAQEKMGVVYISRIPPGMRPAKVRYLMSQYGAIGRVYLQQEDPKRAYLRKKYTATKKAHFTEGWVEFLDKHVARSVAEMLNAQPVGGKKGTRWRDDVWTMKYLPKFKWSMLTEQIAHEAAVHRARLRVELEQSRREQKDYLRQVELARVLDKRVKRKREAAEQRGEQVDEKSLLPPLKKRQQSKREGNNTGENGSQQKTKQDTRKREKDNNIKSVGDTGQLKQVLGSIF